MICGNFAAWGEHSTTTTNLDAPLLRLMLNLASSPETTWSSVDIASAFLNADIHEDDTVLVTPPPTLVEMDTVKPNTVWHVACEESHIRIARGSTLVSERERSASPRTRTHVSRQACSSSAESYSSQPLVHCRRRAYRTFLDSTFRSFSSK